MNDTETALQASQENKLYKIRDKAKSYPEISAAQKQELIGNAVRQQMQALKRGKDRVDLRNADEVENRIMEYLESCAQYGNIPTVLGLAAFCGYSRANLYSFLYHHEDTESAHLIDNFRNVSAAIIAQASMGRTIDNATSIFLLKNCGQGLNDKQEVEVTRGADPTERRRTVSEILERYKDIDLPD
jgi:hypothetical protein